MNKAHRLYLWLACLIAALSSCAAPYANDEMAETYGGGWAKERIPAPMKTTGVIPGVPAYGSPFPLPGQDSWISSFAITREDWWFKDSDPFSEGGLSSKGRARGAVGEGLQLIPLNIRWHNAAFVDRSSGEHWALLDRRAFLSRWWMVLETVDEKPVTERLLFAATIDDTNGDGLLDDRDASVALMTDGSGRNMRRITPVDTQLATVRLYPERGMLGFELRFDVDGDGKFEREDPVRMHFLPLDAEPPTIQPWDDREFQSSLEALYTSPQSQ